MSEKPGPDAGGETDARLDPQPKARRPSKIGAMARKGAVEVTGTVVKALPRELYQIRLEGGQRVTAHLSADENRNFVRILVGDRVIVRLSFWDKARGCVMEKIEKA